MLSVWKQFPPQIKYIVGTEACERFSFYGMRSILVIFAVQHLLMSESHAKSVYHLFIMASYFLPLFGGYIADRIWGKYKTILYLSLLYCVGHAILAMFESKTGLYWGLAFVALGAGGVKPCVSAFVGDQFDTRNEKLIARVFEIFYFAINIGAFLSSLLIPIILPAYGPSVAFGIPGILMGISTLIFWLGRKHYVSLPPVKETSGPGFLQVIRYAFTHQSERRPGHSFLSVANNKYSRDLVEGVEAVWGIVKVFVWITAFWALYDQQGSTWVLQAERMDRVFLGMTVESSQMQAMNAILLLILIPVFGFGIYPGVEKLGFKLTPLKKMSVGMLLTGFSFVAAAIMEMFLDQGVKLNIMWQFFPYVFLTVAEIMVSITGLEFAYTQAPPSMKSTLMSFWFLTFSLGNLLTATISWLNPFTGATEFWFYAALMFVVSGFFVWSASRYRERDFVRGGKA